MYVSNRFLYVFFNIILGVVSIEFHHSSCKIISNLKKKRKKKSNYVLTHNKKFKITDIK
jgi:hypothetical protein